MPTPPQSQLVAYCLDCRHWLPETEIGQECPGGCCRKLLKRRGYVCPGGGFFVSAHEYREHRCTPFCGEVT